MAGTAKILFNHTNIYTKSIPECCLLICLGLLAGEVFFAVHGEHLGNKLLLMTNSRLISLLVTIYYDLCSGNEIFNPHVFFTFILPPIMLEARVRN